MDIIHLHEISVKLPNSPHPDIPADAKVYAQVVIEHSIFIQTLPVVSLDTSGGFTWKIPVGCDIPHGHSSFSIVVLYFNSHFVTHLLGSASIIGDKILNGMKDGQLLELSPQVFKVNSQGPLLVLSAKFSVLPLIKQPLISYNLDSVYTSKELSLDPKAVASCVEKMYKSFQAGESIDRLKIAVMHEGILLPQSDMSGEQRVRLLNMLGNIAFEYAKSRKGHNMDSAVHHTVLQSKRQDLEDLSRAIQVTYDAIVLTPDGHPTKPAQLNTLGGALMARFKQLGDLKDLDRLVQVANDAVTLTPDGHHNKFTYLGNLSAALGLRFEQLEDLQDINRSIQAGDNAVMLTPNDDPNKSARLKNLGDALAFRFKHLGNLEDLNRSIQVLNEAVLHASDDHPNRHIYLNSLGISYWLLFEQCRDLENLSRSIQLQNDAVMLTPDGHPNKPMWLSNLSGSLSLRFEQFRDLEDLNRSIQAADDAVMLTPDGHLSKPTQLNNLSISLLLRFKQLGDIQDLNKSIQLRNDAIIFTPDGHPNKPTLLNNLVISLQVRFEQLHDLKDLDKSIQAADNAIMLTPDGHPDKCKWLDNLGRSLVMRFKQLGGLKDLDRSIQVADNAIVLTPDGHPNMPAHLNNLGTALMLHFKHFGDLQELNRSIQVVDNAVRLTPDGHPNKLKWLNNLGSSLTVRFEQLGDLKDLNRSIQIADNAIMLTPDGHPDKPTHLNNLGCALQAYFERLGSLEDLNRSIQVLDNAVRLTSDNHLKKQKWLTNLGNSLWMRFKQLGDLEDLKRSIQVLNEAVMHAPDGHPDKPMWLNNLGISLRVQFKRLGDLEDLNRSIQLADDAVMLTPNNHSNKPAWLHSLANSLEARFMQLGDLEDLNRSIQVANDAVMLTPDGYPNKPALLGRLSNSLQLRFKQLGDLQDLNRSIQIADDAVMLTPDDHPNKTIQLQNLAISLLTRFERYHDTQDLHQIMVSFSSAAKCIAGPSSSKFRAVVHWLSHITYYYPQENLEIYTLAMNLIPELATLGLSIQDRHHQIREVGPITRDASAIAIAAMKYTTAVEWLELGHSVIWNQVLHLRSEFDELKQLYPKIAIRLQSLSFQLDGSIFTREHVVSSQPIMPQVDYHQLAEEHRQLLIEIRKLPGFESFLLPKPLSQLMRATEDRPIVILNASKIQCGALVLLPGQVNVAYIPLENISLEDLKVWHNGLHSIQQTGFLSILESTIRKGIQISDHKTLNREEGLRYILEKLWHHIAKPILDAISIKEPMNSTSDVYHIWWCTTGPLAFLPIHAAGIYPVGPKLSDFVVSSYTPTLSALLNISHTQVNKEPQLLTVALPKESYPPLPGTGREVECITKNADKFHVVSLLDSQATSEEVAKAMQSSTWVHFACHGIQDSANPTQSCLSLAENTKLTLMDIIKLSLKHAELAFLSACETATGDGQLQDEAVHLAAGMLLAGYHGVIATMWTIDDEFTISVADETYRLLFKEYDADSTRAAEALHFAVKKVSKEWDMKGKSSLFYSVPFIHMGI